ncbi:MAG: beta-galactosidase [Candidatus Margulisbacteria bacterium]|nr:beta-galactosidase [Candidatus Margulisiibacteriota bacterium]MBU1021244.1 beta-galactosidase [Candidatus Margulisiibacteriota bacterium]MBU1729849.1 beta-galactosidase [Candidatus Margulisiibacteriota bacterium]MBU1955350.1 beta-galactosidase [Candidatus Margulisiibacteriota bacterium]
MNKLTKPTLIILALVVAASVSFSFSAPVESANNNLLKNGSFEEGLKEKIPVSWGTEFYNGYLMEDGKVGDVFFQIRNEKSDMSLGAQKIPLDGRDIRRINVSCWVKADNIIPGKEAWQKANIQPLFFDENDKQVGGWPQLGPWDGTFDWVFVKKGFKVPAEARTLKFVLGLYGCTGAISFDDIQVTVQEQKQVDPYNLISNGDFEIWEDWAYGGAEGGGVFSPGYRGDGLLRIINEIPAWSFASQSIPLDGNEVRKIKIEAFWKIQGVAQGAKPWQQARINIEFKDENGKQIGGWPVAASAVGSFDWKKVENSFEVPKEAKRVDIFVGLMEVPGTIWVDDLKMEGFRADGSRVTRKGYFQTDTSSWYEFAPKKAYPVNTAPDVSFILDAPAGKHGYVKVKDGHFYFEDGTRARFWGTNIYGLDCFVDHKTAEQMAERLARFGCNAVRIHHLDAYWADPNIFDKNYNDTQHLDPDQMEKLDYLIYQLEKRGIYIFMDLLVHRRFKEGDEVVDYERVEDGAKISGFYNRRIIDLQKKYAKQLLTHYNPYSKRRYVDDPAMCTVKIINESMLFYISTQVGLSPVYLKELDGLWNDWLKNKYGTRAKLDEAWTDKYGRKDLHADEDFGNIVRGETLLKFQRGGFGNLEKMRDSDTMAFYYDLQVKYYKEMESYLKSIGVKVPMSGSNHWINIAADVKANAVLDYVDRHRYWDHPKYGYGINIVFEDQSMLKYPNEALPNNFAFYRVANKPFFISEWNCCFPNEYRAEGPMVMAAYSNLQDWDGVLLFSFKGGEWGTVMQDNFDMGSWPNVFAQWPAASLLFHRKDVATSKRVVEESLLPQDIYGPIREDNPMLGEPLLPLVTRTQVGFAGSLTDAKNPDIEPILEKYVKEDKKYLTSDTGELTWDWGRGIFKIDTNRTQGAVGFTSGQAIVTKNLEIFPSTDFSSLFITSLDNQPLSTAKKMLVTATAKVENTGEIFNAAKTQLKEVGRAPILVEGVNAKILLKRKVSSATVYALNIAGQRIKQVPVTRKSNGVEFSISGTNKALFYEVLVK